MRTATVTKDGGRALILATYDGCVLCHMQTGRFLWKAEMDGFPFDPATADLDGNGLDESLAASSDGTLYSAADAKRVPRIGYRMNLLTPVHLQDEVFLLGLFGNLSIRYAPDGVVREVSTGPYAFADAGPSASVSATVGIRDGGYFRDIAFLSRT